MHRYFFIILFLTFVGFPMAVISEGNREINLYPVQKDTPVFNRANDKVMGIPYPISMIKVSENGQVIVPPSSEAKILYFGEVKFGLPPVKYGVLIDLEGKDKMLWLDSDGDGDYGEEKPYLLFKSDRYPGLNVYYSPLPLGIKVKYTLKNGEYATSLQFDLLFLVTERKGFSDCFYLRTRTWFIGELVSDKEDYRIAIVDTNDNGLYTDPEDLVFIDSDYDLNFSPQEGKVIKKGSNLKLRQHRFYFDYRFCPQKIIVTEG